MKTLPYCKAISELVIVRMANFLEAAALQVPDPTVN